MLVITPSIFVKNVKPSKIEQVTIICSHQRFKVVNKFHKYIYIYIKVVLLNRLCTFQVYAMPVFDNMEMRYITKKKKPCSKGVRTCLRILFGGLTFLAAVALPFFGSLTLLMGGIALPLTFAYPCFMWIAMKKLRPNRVVWSINLVLGCFGIVFSVLIVIAAAWTLSDKGLKSDFFKP